MVVPKLALRLSLNFLATLLATDAAACVVGDGTNASCNETALDACLPGGAAFDGSVSFNCGGLSTISVTGTKVISQDTTLDGGSVVTIRGSSSFGLFRVPENVAFDVRRVAMEKGSASAAPYDNGGAITSRGILTVSEGRFSQNHAAGGGAVFCAEGSSAHISDSSFDDNTGQFYGGAIQCGGTLVVNRSKFERNTTAYYGGAINSGGGTVDVTNSTFVSNSAGLAGGAFQADGTSTITNCTFKSNSATGYGGGAVNAWGGPCVIRNSILAGSVGENCYGGSRVDGGHNIDDGNSCGFSLANGSMSQTDPKLDAAGLADNGGPTETIALQSGSPAIDSGNAESAPPRREQRR